MGVAVSLAVPLHHKLVAVAVAFPAAGCAIIAFGVVAYFLDDGDLKVVLALAAAGDGQAAVVTRAISPQSSRTTLLTQPGTVCWVM